MVLAWTFLTIYTTSRDKKLTLLQNYRRLGITSNLNEPTGGTEKHASSQPNPSSDSSVFKKVNDPLHISTSSKPTKQLNPTEARVERDPETGEILRIIYDGEEEATEVIAGRRRRKDNPLEDPLDDIPDGPALEESDELHPAPGVISALEEQAREEEEALKKRKPRTQSKREGEWIGKLIEKHGDNVRAMVRDKKLNPMQQTEGDLQRRIRKWKEARESR